MWFACTWDGADALVKVNVTERERWWMATMSDGVPDAVAHVHASGTDLDGLDIRWLVLERLGVRPPDPPTQQWCGATLDAALVFQTAARTLDTSLVDDEGLSFWERISVLGETAPPPAPELMTNLADDLAWIDANIERHTMFGDLHFGNLAARRSDDSRHPQVRLFDPIPRRQPWVFEAVYFEQSCRGSVAGLVAEMAERRHAAGLPTPREDVVHRAETLMQAWIGVMWWRVIPTIQTDPAASARLLGWLEASRRARSLTAGAVRTQVPVGDSERRVSLVRGDDRSFRSREPLRRGSRPARPPVIADPSSSPQHGRSGAHTFAGSPSGYLQDIPRDVSDDHVRFDRARSGQNSDGVAADVDAGARGADCVDGPASDARAGTSNAADARAAHTASRSTPRDSARWATGTTMRRRRRMHSRSPLRTSS